ncbi:hypothetical protein BS47DRAFT_795818 [Hydnum rufescens UP504]|uniref:Uncharacterized protein n=1 Tax=Hydnum rufescens UP504 TaxID=1448309 RepID=A0A9P6AE39_9AGAM|nr:hypothetical protein BS47DRAFT_795818 [Hydnum rufescens UP504]
MGTHPPQNAGHCTSHYRGNDGFSGRRAGLFRTQHTPRRSPSRRCETCSKFFKARMNHDHFYEPRPGPSSSPSHVQHQIHSCIGGCHTFRTATIYVKTYPTPWPCGGALSTWFSSQSRERYARGNESDLDSGGRSGWRGRARER